MMGAGVISSGLGGHSMGLQTSSAIDSVTTQAIWLELQDTVHAGAEGVAGSRTLLAVVSPSI